MDYYQKYQKYKFKYLNLLNQFGGYTDEEFKIMLEKPNIDGYLVEKLVVCPISLQYVQKDHGILIDRAIYDVNYLLEFFKYFLNTKTDQLPTLPHNRGRFTEEIYLNILSKVLKNGLNWGLVFKMIDVYNLIVYIINEYIFYNSIIIDHDTIDFIIKYSYENEQIDHIEYNKSLMNTILQITKFNEIIQKKLLSMNYIDRHKLLKDKSKEEIIMLYS